MLRSIATGFKARWWKSYVGMSVESSLKMARALTEFFEFQTLIKSSVLQKELQQGP